MIETKVHIKSHQKCIKPVLESAYNCWSSTDSEYL